MVEQEVLDGRAEGGVFDERGPPFGAGRQDSPGGALAELVGQAHVEALGQLPSLVLAGIVKKADERGEGVVQYGIEEGRRNGRGLLGAWAVAVGVPLVDDTLQVSVVKAGE
ncbi:hypothetical protein [Streptomyces aculeolatus]|uniref:hypothetical protein n=1 Tax=Streptomyces aculeolatus TaxID=270689 RepID=UPI001CECF9E0|nr:hypothetical protein [Streptomyces aculeolatus]